MNKKKKLVVLLESLEGGSVDVLLLNKTFEKHLPSMVLLFIEYDDLENHIHEDYFYLHYANFSYPGSAPHVVVEQLNSESKAFLASTLSPIKPDGPGIFNFESHNHLIDKVKEIVKD